MQDYNHGSIRTLYLGGEVRQIIFLLNIWIAHDKDDDFFFAWLQKHLIYCHDKKYLKI